MHMYVRVCVCVCVCSVNLKVTEKSFNFARKYKLPLYFVSASDGTNVVKVNSIIVITAVTITRVLLMYF